jgi:hypothetical protein
MMINFLPVNLSKIYMFLFFHLCLMLQLILPSRGINLIITLKRVLQTVSIGRILIKSKVCYLLIHKTLSNFTIELDRRELNI